MRIRDKRFHAAQESLHVKAAHLLTELSKRAFDEPMMSAWGDNIRHAQRNRDRFPDAYGNKPGAFLEKWCTPKQRELLQHLESDANAFLPLFFRFILPPGHPDNKICGVLEWSPATIWSFT